MKKIISSNTKENLSKINITSIGKNFDFKEISKKSKILAESIDPISNIKYLSKNMDIDEIMQIRFSELSKYKLSQFLNREIQQEILVGGDLISSKINNQIVASGFNFSEDKTNNLFLHKRVSDYFILVHFKYLKPNKDQRKIIKYRNEQIEEQYRNFGNNTGMMQKLTGADFNPDFKSDEHEDKLGMGIETEQEMYQDLTPFYFNINLVNKRSETLQYVCFSEETKISIDKIKYFSTELTQNFAFLSDLKASKDDWDLMKEKQKLEFNHVRSNEILKGRFSKDLQIDVYSPTFYTLNKALQEEMIQVLNKIGITSEINNFTRYLGINRERREYVSWLFKFLNILNYETENRL